jgi:hypothetical protein
MYTANRTVIQHITRDRTSTAPNCGHQAGIRSTVFSVAIQPFSSVRNRLVGGLISIEPIGANVPRSGVGSASDELVTH